MPTLEIEQKSMLTNANDGGLFLRIQKEHVAKITAAKLKDRRVQVKIIITY